MIVNVDLSFMYDHNVVIHCETKKQSDELIEAIVNYFDVYEDRACDWRVTWNKYKKSTCHRFNLHDDGTITYGFCNIEWYIGDGKRVVEYSTLTTVIDYGEIESGFSSNADALYALL